MWRGDTPASASRVKRAGMVTATSTVEAILRCARSSIVGGGYNGFSCADIAAVVGIRKASIHHHFPTNVDLVRTLVKQYRDEAEAGIAEIERHVADPLEQLRSYARRLASVRPAIYAPSAPGKSAIAILTILLVAFGIVPPRARRRGESRL
jgi:AcrR family transcriptional regulator